MGLKAKAKRAALGAAYIGKHGKRRVAKGPRSKARRQAKAKGGK